MESWQAPQQQINFEIFGWVVRFCLGCVICQHGHSLCKKRRLIGSKLVLVFTLEETSSVPKEQLWAAPKPIRSRCLPRVRFYTGIQIILCIGKFPNCFRSLNASLASIVSICLPIVVEKKSCKKLSRWSFEIGMNIWWALGFIEGVTPLVCLPHPVNNQHHLHNIQMSTLKKIMSLS